MNLVGARLRLGRARELALRLLGTLPEALQGHLVLRQVDALASLSSVIYSFV